MEHLSGEVVTRSLGEVGTTVAFILLGTVLLEVLIYVVLGVVLKYKYTLPFMLLGPAIVGLLALIIYPLIWEFNLSLTNMSLRRFGDKAEYNWIACQANPDAIRFWLTDCLIRNYADVFRLPVLKHKVT